MTCIWNGGGYYMDMFVCGTTYPSGLTFYCCSDCHRKLGESERVFLSYRWCDGQIAEKIARRARGARIDVIRDVNRIGFLDSIASFMDSSVESRYFVAVMSESYFYSRYCMYELCHIATSDEPIRTIPLLLGTAVEPGIEDRLRDYWRGRHQDLTRRMLGIDERYTRYLRPEIDLLESFPSHVENFYALWRAKERPKGERWLTADCRYLMGAIKTTFKPTEEEATNWTYSPKIVREERTEDAPLAAKWKPQPFYLHARSETELQVVTRVDGAQELLLGVYRNELASEPLPGGVHVALVTESSLMSLTFCKRLQWLIERDDVTLVPLFLDDTLQMPGSELGLLRQWHDRLTQAETDLVRDDVDSTLRSFGPMMERLRDTLVPSPAVLFEG